MADEDQEALAAQWAAQLEAEGGAPDVDVDALMANAGGGDAAPSAPAAGAAPQAAAANDEEALAAQWAEALASEEEHADTGPKAFGGPAAGSLNSVQDAHFNDMTEMSRQPRDNKLKRELDFILDIPLDVSAELGRTRLLINELLQLGQGSVVELNKLAGEPLEVYVNGKLVARGEAVVINEKFGVRLTDIISPIERVKQLG